MSGAKWLPWAALLAAAATDAHAQQVHLLLAGDTADRTIGNSVRHDLEATAGTFYLLLSQGQLDQTRLPREQVSAEGILSAIDRFSVKPDDALVCYWSGHGAFDDDGHYLQMPQGGNLRRSTLLGAMKKKQARLTVLLTDCCNQYRDATVGKKTMAPSADPRRSTCPLFDDLFLKSRGLVDVNAASQGEVAVNTNDGGLFTLSLMCMTAGQNAAEGEGYRPDKVLGAFWRNARKEVAWQTLIQESRRQVQEFFEQINPDGLSARDGTVYHKQTVVAWSLPGEAGAKSPQDGSSRFGVEAIENSGDGVLVVRVWPDYPGTHVTDATGESFSIDRGDVIVAINGRKIGSLADYAEAVNHSPTTMKVTVRDVNDGTKHEVQAELRGEAAK